MNSIDAVTARIATLHARVQAMHAQPASGMVGTTTPGAARKDGGFADAMAKAEAAGKAPAATVVRRAEPDAAREATGPGATPESPDSTADPVAGPWAERLPDHARPWAGRIQQAADQAGVDADLLASLVWTESDFRPDARSRVGAVGLAQLMPDTAVGLGVDPHDPDANLAGGAAYLREQLDRFGSVQLALAAYNAGPSRVAQAGGIPDIPETRAYVPSVLGHLSQLKGTA